MQLGKPYVYGGSGPDSWDCSGLTRGAFAAIGIDLPHDSTLQAVMGNSVPIDPSAVQPGDLIFRFGDGVENGHVGIAESSSTMIVAPHTGDVVKEQSIDYASTTAIRRLVQGSGMTPLSAFSGGVNTQLIPPAAYDLFGNPFNGLKDLVKMWGNIYKRMLNKQNLLRLVQGVMGAGGMVIGLIMMGIGMKGDTIIPVAETAAKAAAVL